MLHRAGCFGRGRRPLPDRLHQHEARRMRALVSSNRLPCHSHSILRFPIAWETSSSGLATGARAREPHAPSAPPEARRIRRPVHSPSARGPLAGTPDIRAPAPTHRPHGLARRSHRRFDNFPWPFGRIGPVGRMVPLSRAGERVVARASHDRLPEAAVHGPEEDRHHRGCGRQGRLQPGHRLPAGRHPAEPGRRDRGAGAVRTLWPTPETRTSCRFSRPARSG